MESVELIDRDDVSGDGESSTKLLCLHLSAIGKLLSRDPGREAKIVLDLGAGARLSARRDALYHQRRKPLRGSVHRRSKTRRTGADNDEVIDGLRIKQLREAQLICQVCQRGLVQDAPIREESQLARSIDPVRMLLR